MPENTHKKSVAQGRVMAVSALALLVFACVGMYLLRDKTAVYDSQVVDQVQGQVEPGMDYAYKNATGSYLAGKFSAAQGDVKGALKHIGEAMAYQQTDKQLLRQAYRLSVLAGEFDQAGSYAEKLPEEESDRLLNPQMLQAVLAIKKNDFTVAAKKLAEIKPEGANTLFLPALQGWVDMGLGKPLDVAGLMESLRISAQFKPLLRYQIALLLDAAGKTAEAAEQYDAVNADKQLSFRIAEVLANFYQRQDNQEKRDDVQERYQQQFGHSLGEVTKTPVVSTPREGAAEIFYGIGSVLFGLDAYAEAQVPLLMALDLRPDFDAVKFLQANLLERQERLEEAIAAYQQLADHPAFGLQAQIRMAYCYQDSDNPKAALALLEKVQEKFPTEVEPLLTKADILRVAQKYPEAIAGYTEALERTNGQKAAKRWPLLYARGIAYERSDQWDKAEADFLEALRLEPDQPDVLNYLGYSWLIQDKHLTQAKEMIEKAMALRPQDAHIIDSMGWAMYHLGEYEEALEYMEQAVELAPRDPTVNDHLGDVYWRLGYQLQAKYQWERALLFEPEEPGQEESLRKKIAEGLPALTGQKPKMLSQNAAEVEADAIAGTGKN